MLVMYAGWLNILARESYSSTDFSGQMFGLIAMVCGLSVGWMLLSYIVYRITIQRRKAKKEGRTLPPPVYATAAKSASGWLKSRTAKSASKQAVMPARSAGFDPSLQPDLDLLMGDLPQPDLDLLFGEPEDLSSLAPPDLEALYGEPKTASPALLGLDALYNASEPEDFSSPAQPDLSALFGEAESAPLEPLDLEALYGEPVIAAQPAESTPRTYAATLPLFETAEPIPADSEPEPALESEPVSEAAPEPPLESESELESEPEPEPQAVHHLTEESSPMTPSSNQDVPADAVELLRVYRDLSDGSLIIQVGDRRFNSLDELRGTDFERRFLNVLRDLNQMARTAFAGSRPASAPAAQTPAGQAPAAAPTAARSIPAAPAPAAAPSTQAVPAKPVTKPTSGHDLEDLSLSPGTMLRQMTKVALGHKPEPIEHAPILSVAEQIEQILQDRIRKLPDFRNRSIHVRQAPGGGVRIEVDGESFEGVGDVTDVEVRNLILGVVREWEGGS